MPFHFLTAHRHSTCTALSALAVILSMLLLGGAKAAVLLATVGGSLVTALALLYVITRLISGPFDRSISMPDRFLPGFLFSFMLGITVAIWIAGFGSTVETKAGHFIGFSSGHTMGGIACLFAAAICAFCIARKFMWEHGRQARVIGLAFGATFSTMAIVPLALTCINLPS